MHFPNTLIEAVRCYSNLDVCQQFMVTIKWPSGQVVCPECGGERIGQIRSRRMFQCKAKDCRKQFSVKVGTIFEDSPLGLDKWFVAVWCIVNAKNGISSCELARALGVTQKSAWHMLHRIRMAMAEEKSGQLQGIVESDETFVGGKFKNMHKSKRERLPHGRGTVGKAVVHGMLDRGNGNAPSQVRLGVVPNQKRNTLHAKIEQHVKTGSVIYTDKLASYEGLDWGYFHDCVDHAVEYVRGEVHTNGMENFWSLLKRMLGGTYVSVAPKHLVRYCSEQAFRFNKRKGGDAARFKIAMKNTPGKRLTYRELASKT